MLLIVGASYQAIQTRGDFRHFSPRGKFVLRRHGASPRRPTRRRPFTYQRSSLTTCAGNPDTLWQGTYALLCCGFAAFQFIDASDATDYISIADELSGSGNGGNISPSGTFTSTTITPELPTGVLTMTGVVFGLLMRKRIAKFLHLDTGTHRSLSSH